MKLSSATIALLVLALGASSAEARASTRRRTTRRAEEEAGNDVVATAEEDLITTDGAGNSNKNNKGNCDCAQDVIHGVIHLTVPELPEPCCDDGFGNFTGGSTGGCDGTDWTIEGATAAAYSTLRLLQTVPSVGTIAIAWEPIHEVEIISSSGTFDVDTCFQEEATFLDL